MTDMHELSDMRELTAEELDLVSGGGIWSDLFEGEWTLFTTSPASLLHDAIASNLRGH